MKMLFSSAAFVAILAVGAGTGSQLFAQNFGGQLQPNFGGQHQPNYTGQPGGAVAPGGQPIGTMPMNQPNAAPANPRSFPPAGGAGGAPTTGQPQVGVNGIAVIDVAFIFKNYPKFKFQMDQMKQKVDAAENDIKKDQEDLKHQMDQLKQLSPSSDGYKKLEADILKKQGDMNVKVKMQQKDFMEQEGHIYYNISREVDDAVRLLATRYGIVLVLRFSSDEVDPSDRNDILRGINKIIVYNDPRMNITQYVLNELNRSGGASMTDVRGNTMPVPQRQPR